VVVSHISRIIDTVEPSDLAKDAFEGIAASGVRQAYLQRGYSVEEVEVEVNVSTSQKAFS